jgi:hypothetical protein
MRNSQISFIKGLVHTFERGAFFVEAALITPVLLFMVLGILDPLYVAFRHDWISYALTQVAHEARELDDLQADFWNQGTGSEYDKFKAARAELSQKFANAVSGIGGVTLRPITHLDRVGSDARFEELTLGYLPPGTSAYVAAWNDGSSNLSPASLNHSHYAGYVTGYNEGDETDKRNGRQYFDAATRHGKRPWSVDSPYLEVVKDRGQTTILGTDIAGKLDHLPTASTLFPTELAVAAEIRGLYGNSHRMVISVPFWPNSARPWQKPPTLPVCLFAPGSWTPWGPTCDLQSRSITQADGCSNSRVLTDYRCSSEESCWINQQGRTAYNHVANGGSPEAWSSNCASGDGKRLQQRWQWNQGTQHNVATPALQCSQYRNLTTVSGCLSSDPTPHGWRNIGECQYSAGVCSKGLQTQENCCGQRRVVDCELGACSRDDQSVPHGSSRTFYRFTRRSCTNDDFKDVQKSCSDYSKELCCRNGAFVSLSGGDPNNFNNASCDDRRRYWAVEWTLDRYKGNNGDMKISGGDNFCGTSIAGVNESITGYADNQKSADQWRQKNGDHKFQIGKSRADQFKQMMDAMYAEPDVTQIIADNVWWGDINDDYADNGCDTGNPNKDTCTIQHCGWIRIGRWKRKNITDTDKGGPYGCQRKGDNGYECRNTNCEGGDDDNECNVEIKKCELKTKGKIRKTFFFGPNDDEECQLLNSDNNKVQCGSTIVVEEDWRSPISLILDAGAKLEGNVAMFRLDPSRADGQQVQWFGSSSSPLLVWDPEHKGTIVDGSQLFGTSTFGKKWKHGYEPLATLDRNGDMKLSGDELDALGVWLDKEQDAVSQPGEVVRLSELGIEEIFVSPDAEQPDKDKGLLWATRGFTRLVDGERSIFPSVDWFTPEGGVVAHLMSAAPDVQPSQAMPKTQSDPTTALDSPRFASAADERSATKNAPFEVWRWGIGQDEVNRAPANRGGWLTVQRGDRGAVMVMSVVVAPLKENPDGVNSVASSNLFSGTEQVRSDGSREIGFGGVVFDGAESSSGVTVESSVLISPDGKTMSGQTVQKPFGKSRTRKIRYSWTGVKVGNSAELDGG